MTKTKKNEAGFSAVELVMALVIVALIGVVGFMVYKAHNKKTSDSATTTSITRPAATAKTTTPKTQPITSYDDCIKSKNTTTDTKAYPSTCTMPDSVVYKPTDPSNFARVQAKINIPNNPSVTTDSKVAESNGYCFNSEVPGPQATATLDKMVGNYALVSVTPNCGDSFELTYNKVSDHWATINQSHLGLCFNPAGDSSSSSNPAINEAVSKLCN